MSGVCLLCSPNRVCSRTCPQNFLPMLGPGVTHLLWPHLPADDPFVLFPVRPSPGTPDVYPQCLLSNSLDLQTQHVPNLLPVPFFQSCCFCSSWSKRLWCLSQLIFLSLPTLVFFIKAGDLSSKYIQSQPVLTTLSLPAWSQHPLPRLSDTIVLSFQFYLSLF